MYLFCVFLVEEKLNYDRFVYPNILGAVQLVHSDLRIYRISFILLDLRAKLAIHLFTINYVKVLYTYFSVRRVSINKQIVQIETWHFLKTPRTSFQNFLNFIIQQCPSWITDNTNN